MIIGTLNSLSNSFETDIARNAAVLMSQQLWCWGQDILRPDGNWLLEIGFDRNPPPPERPNCPSMYTLLLPNKAVVLLRGFGVFYGKAELGGIFLPRYEFQPGYTNQPTLKTPPWTRNDLPALRTPSKAQQKNCIILTLEAIDWIRSYEVEVLDRLGVEYRETTLSEWDDGEKDVIPADSMASSWRSLGIAFSDHSQSWVRGKLNRRSN